MLINFGSDERTWTQGMHNLVTQTYSDVINVDVPEYKDGMETEELERKAERLAAYIQAMYSKVIHEKPNTTVLIGCINPLTMAVFRRLRANNIHVATPKYVPNPKVDGEIQIFGMSHFLSH